MKIWTITVVTAGKDVKLDVPEGDVREVVQDIFKTGLWIGNTYYPPSALFSATIEQQEIV